MDNMEVDTEVDPSTWGVRLQAIALIYYILAVYSRYHNNNFLFAGGCSTGSLPIKIFG